jgi:hypothetical protein
VLISPSATMKVVVGRHLFSKAVMLLLVGGVLRVRGCDLAVWRYVRFPRVNSVAPGSASAKRRSDSRPSPLELSDPVLRSFMKLDYRVSFINDRPRLEALGEALASVPVVALDIETTDWWSPQTEQVALVQLTYRNGGGLRAAVVDAPALPELAPLRRPLELNTVTKAVHNAAFDAARLSRHFRIDTAPIYDTLIAARRNGERRYSLKAQAETHLGLKLDKDARLSDWGMRPLSPHQVDYAAMGGRLAAAL